MSPSPLHPTALRAPISCEPCSWARFQGIALAYGHFDHVFVNGPLSLEYLRPLQERARAERAGRATGRAKGEGVCGARRRCVQGAGPRGQRGRCGRSMDGGATAVAHLRLCGARRTDGHTRLTVARRYADVSPLWNCTCRSCGSVRDGTARVGLCSRLIRLSMFHPGCHPGCSQRLFVQALELQRGEAARPRAT
eukprot:6212299-Pleurochrysis_carterae.AAC.4